MNHLTAKNTLLQKHNTEINEQIELLKKHTTKIVEEMDEKIALLHKTNEKNDEQIELLKIHTTEIVEEMDVLQINNEKNNEQFDLLKPEITKINIHNSEMSNRYETAIQEVSELIGLVVIENDISAKIQTTVSNITKYFEFFEKLRISSGDNSIDISLWIRFPETRKLYEYKHIIYLGFSGSGFNPFTHTPIMMKYFSKYYNKQQDRFLPLQFAAGGGDDGRIRFTEQHNEYTRDHKMTSLQYTKAGCGSPLYVLINRHIIQLLHETDEEFELKILENVLIELEKYYVNYKQYEYNGVIKH